VTSVSTAADMAQTNDHKPHVTSTTQYTVDETANSQLSGCSSSSDTVLDS